MRYPSQQPGGDTDRRLLPPDPPTPAGPLECLCGLRWACQRDRRHHITLHGCGVPIPATWLCTCNGYFDTYRGLARHMTQTGHHAPTLKNRP